MASFDSKSETATPEKKDPDERVKNARCAWIEWDTDLRVLRWSKGAEDVFGWSASEVLGRIPCESGWKFAIGGDRYFARAILESAARQDSGKSAPAPATIHERNLSKDGRILNCTWHTTFASEEPGDGSRKTPPHKARLISLVVDESEIVRDRKELELERERLSLALKASAVKLWDWNLLTDEVTSVGEQWEAASDAGQNPERMIAQVFANVVPEDLMSLKAAIEQAIATRSDFRNEFRYRLQDGLNHWIEVKGRVAFDDLGNPLRISGSALDMTERRKSESDLRAAKLAAENANAMKNAALATMSHEIRTPLGVILGFATLLGDPGLPASERGKYAEVINRNGQLLLRLIDDILDLSKIEAGRVEVRRSPVTLVDVLRELEASLKTAVASKSVELVFDIGAGQGLLPRQIETDPVRFKQILANLIGNSIKFTDSGEVRVTVGTRPGGDGADFLYVRIQDTGIGISREGQKYLFEPFVQVDRSATEEFGGSGLGLALSRRLARALGGDVVLLDSVPRKGTIFEFTTPCISQAGRTLPEQRGSAAEIGPSKGSQLKPLDGLKLLLAEDSADNQILMDRVLRKRGAAVIIVSNGEEAVAKSSEFEFDAVLMDIQMPVLDGYQATRKLRARGYRAPIIALTAHAMKEERQKCIEAGCDDHLAKPIDSDALVRTILHYTRAKVSVTNHT